MVLPEPAEVVRRKVQACCNLLCPKGVEGFPNDVSPKWRVHDAKVGSFCVPHRETRVVLCGEYDVSDTSESSQRRPVLRVELPGIEGLRQLVVEPVCVGLIGSCQRVRDYDS